MRPAKQPAERQLRLAHAAFGDTWQLRQHLFQQFILYEAEHGRSARRLLEQQFKESQFLSALKALRETLLILEVNPPNVRIIIDNVIGAASLVVDPAIPEPIS